MTALEGRELKEINFRHVIHMTALAKSSAIVESILSCRNLYISENINALALEFIEQAARLYPESVIINKFRASRTRQLNKRVCYTFVSAFGKNPLLNSATKKKI